MFFLVFVDFKKIELFFWLLELVVCLLFVYNVYLFVLWFLIVVIGFFDELVFLMLVFKKIILLFNMKYDFLVVKVLFWFLKFILILVCWLLIFVLLIKVLFDFLLFVFFNILLFKVVVFDKCFILVVI